MSTSDPGHWVKMVYLLGLKIRHLWKDMWVKIVSHRRVNKLTLQKLITNKELSHLPYYQLIFEALNLFKQVLFVRAMTLRIWTLFWCAWFPAFRFSLSAHVNASLQINVWILNQAHCRKKPNSGHSQSHSCQFVWFTCVKVNMYFLVCSMK